MLTSTFTAVVLSGYLVLFFGVHIYMDVQMFRSRKLQKSVPVRDEFIISLPAKILAFIPSVIFWITFFVSPFLFFFDVYKDFFAPVLLQSPYENLLQGAGFILVLTGIILADWGRVSRGVVAPSGPMPQDYRITTKGAYRIVRHPMYVSYSLFFIGFPLILLNLVLFLCFMGIPGYYMIAKEEENVLIRRFGKEYTEYQEKVGMFIPKAW